MASDPSLDAWLGARNFAAKKENLQKFQVTRADYDELGGEYLKFHSMGNQYFPTPQFIPTLENTS
jgi:actin-related protein 5